MKFHRVIGKIDPAVISKAEQLLSVAFLELAAKPDIKIFGSKMGGDPLLFSLIFPMQHVATTHIATAATDGRRYYWNPHFVNSLHLLGLRIVIGHEAWHSIYMHPQRRGGRNSKLWNIAVDLIVNNLVMADLQYRGLDPATHFTKYLGNYLTLPQTLEMFDNPFAFAKKYGFPIEHISTETSDKQIKLPHPNEDRELTEEEKKALQEEMKRQRFYYADPNLNGDCLRPEKIYEMLLKKTPQCPQCGRLGIYYPPNDQKDKHSDQDKQGHGCGGCAGGYDIFQLGETLDDHIDTEGTREEVAKRFADAAQSAKRMAGNIPAALEIEIDRLTEPQIKWTDFIRLQLTKSRNGNARNDWTRFKTRPLLAGMLVPKRKSFVANFIAVLDTSSSMTKEDKSLVLSQLMSLDDKAEGWLVCNDAIPYWDQAVKLKTVNREALLQIKPIGAGGTQFAPFFKDYEDHFGKSDFIIMLTDGGLAPEDIAAMKQPPCPVYWVIGNTIDFTPPFGRVFHLYN